MIADINQEATPPNISVKYASNPILPPWAIILGTHIKLGKNITGHTNLFNILEIFFLKRKLSRFLKNKKPDRKKKKAR